MSYIIYPLIALGIFFFGGWMYFTIKTAKDPDVQIASDLRMTIRRYRIYEKLYDKYRAAMEQYGIESKEANEIFRKKIYPRIPNTNEWRRYCDYRARKQTEENHKNLGID